MPPEDKRFIPRGLEKPCLFAGRAINEELSEFIVLGNDGCRRISSAAIVLAIYLGNECRGKLGFRLWLKPELYRKSKWRWTQVTRQRDPFI